MIHINFCGAGYHQTNPSRRYRVGVLARGCLCFCLSLVNLLVFAWLFIRSPQHRWPVVIMLTGQVASRMVHSGQSGYRPVRLDDDLSLYVAFPYAMYAIALFRFHIFDPVPLPARRMLEQMHEGMRWLILTGRLPA
jgi:hypothetical protein